MTDTRWCIDTELNTRFPVYTRFNANDVLPDPITPLGASMAWIPHMLPGSSMGYAALGTVTAEGSIDSAAWPFGAFCYGHLYVNVTMARNGKCVLMTAAARAAAVGKFQSSWATTFSSR